MILGILSLVAIVVGCLGCGVLGIVTYPLGALFATIGILLGFFGRGNLRVAGIVLNFVALLPAILLAVLVFTGGAVLGLGGRFGSQAPAGKAPATEKKAEVVPKREPTVGSSVGESTTRERCLTNGPTAARPRGEPIAVLPVRPEGDSTGETAGPNVPPKKTLADKLRDAKITINTPTALYNSVANKDVRIIEIADTCTADQFDAEQTRLLRDWVSQGGVLWVNNNVLLLLGVRYSELNAIFLMECVPAGGRHPILEGCKRVSLTDCRGKAHTLQYRGVIPLLAAEKFMYGPPEGAALWSLVRYGNGWISDPKAVHEGLDGALFWGRFCQFCLREIPWPQVGEDGEMSEPLAPEKVTDQAFEEWKTKAKAATLAAEYETALGLLKRANRARPEDTDVKKLLADVSWKVVNKLRSNAQHGEALRHLAELARMIPDDANVRQTVEEVTKLNEAPETTDLTGIWGSGGTGNKFQLAVEGSRVKVDGVGPNLALTGGKKVDAVSGTWQREGTRLNGDLVVVFADGQRVSIEVSANITSRTTLRVRWKDAKWDPARKKWVGWGYIDWEREQGGVGSGEAVPTEPTGPRIDFPRERPGYPFGAQPGRSARPARDPFSPGHQPGRPLPAEKPRPRPADPFSRR